MKMVTKEVLNSVAEILATGILRMRRRETNQMIGDGSFVNTEFVVAGRSAHCATSFMDGESR